MNRLDTTQLQASEQRLNKLAHALYRRSENAWQRKE